MHSSLGRRWLLFRFAAGLKRLKSLYPSHNLRVILSPLPLAGSSRTTARGAPRVATREAALLRLRPSVLLHNLPEIMTMTRPFQIMIMTMTMINSDPTFVLLEYLVSYKQLSQLRYS